MATEVPVPSGYDPAPVEGKTVKALTLNSIKRTYDLFAGNRSLPVALEEKRQVQIALCEMIWLVLMVACNSCSQRIKISCKVADEYAAVQHLVAPVAASTATVTGW